MADNQRKKPTPEQKRQREKINSIIKKKTGKGITELVEANWPKNKGKYYDNVIKIPLPPDFVDLIKETFDVDLSDFMQINYDFSESKEVSEYVKFLESRVKLLENENTTIRGKLEAFSEMIDKLIKDKK